FFQAEDGIRDFHVTGVQTCALPIFRRVTGLMRPSPALTEPLMSSDTPVRSRSPFRRPSTDDGPRASLKQLLPFLLEHKGVLVVRSEERRVGKDGHAVCLRDTQRDTL